MRIDMHPNEFIVSKTDLKGRITYGNETFIKMSGYQERELLNAPHNLLRHPDMPAVVFRLLWQRIQGKQGIHAFVKNRTKDAKYYWVFANVTPSCDEAGNVVGYYSVRRRPSDKALSIIEPLYRELAQIERRYGINEAHAHLEKHLAAQGLDYDEFVIRLQK
ncbi:MAG: PAS sensor protein [Sulfuricurvum sp. PC08-66]|nr:MAG: PAS sensor protein [Sulfuricurvum sp. PC08-66]